MKRTNFFLPEPARKELQELSQVTGLSVSEHLRRAIDEYLSRHKQPMPAPVGAQPSPESKP